MSYLLLIGLMLVLLVLGYVLNNRLARRSAEVLSEEIERYIDAEVAIRVEATLQEHNQSQITPRESPVR